MRRAAGSRGHVATVLLALCGSCPSSAFLGSGVAGRGRWGSAVASRSRGALGAATTDTTADADAASPASDTAADADAAASYKDPSKLPDLPPNALILTAGDKT